MTELYHALKQAIQQSQFQAAIEQATQALLQSPDDIELLYLLAVAQRYATLPEQAINSLNRLLKLLPTHGRAHQEAGYCHLALADQQTARQAFHLATVANPALLTAWQQLQKLSADSGSAETAHISEQIRHLSHMPKPLLAALDLKYEGKYAAAEQLCRQYLHTHKHHPQAMCLLAEIGALTKVYDDATFLLESCIALYPDYQPAKKQWVDLLNQLGQYHRALPLAEQLVTQQADDYLAKSALAASQVGVGNIDAGIHTYRGILAQQPNRAGIYLQLGHAYKAKGEFAQAIHAYQQAYQNKPGYGDAYWSLANTKTYRFSDDELATMHKYADHAAGEHQDRIHLCFALGKALEDRQDFQQSFHYYQLGNRLKSKSAHHDPDRHEQLVALQIKHCDRSLFQQPGSGNPAADPIFIVGLPRAGSTLLEQILSSHSQVDATMELHSILGMAMKLRGRMSNDEPAYPANLRRLSAEQLKQLGDQFIQETRHYRQGAPLFIDKMPNNFMHIGLIKLILPNAKIIDARRDPMACCFSGFKQLFGEGQEFSYDLAHLGRYYSAYVKLMQHWDTVLPGQVLRVQHEDVVEDLEAQVRRILDYCGLPFEQSCIDFYKTERTIKTPSSEQVRQPIYRSGLEQWKHFEDFLTPLKNSLASAKGD